MLERGERRAERGERREERGRAGLSPGVDQLTNRSDDDVGPLQMNIVT
jgi:hypothetical protein